MTKETFPLALLFEFNRGIKAAEATKNMCAVYGECVIAERTPRRWSPRFKEENFDLTCHTPNDPKTLMKTKQGPYPKKTMLCLWRDQLGVIYYEPILKNQIISIELCCQELRRYQKLFKKKEQNHNAK